jgi:hypothetical protein
VPEIPSEPVLEGDPDIEIEAWVDEDETHAPGAIRVEGVQKAKRKKSNLVCSPNPMFFLS